MDEIMRVDSESDYNRSGGNPLSPTGWCFFPSAFVHGRFQEQAVALLEGDIISEQGSNTRAKLILSGLDLDVLPHALLAVKHDRLVVLHLQRNKLALLPSELFLRLTELQEIDVSEVQMLTSIYNPL